MKQFISLLLILLFSVGFAQENIDYQKPPNEILELADVPLAPRVLLDNNRQHMVLLYRDAYKTIEELSQEELRLGGLRINPLLNIGSRVRYYNNIEIRNLQNDENISSPVVGLPESLYWLISTGRTMRKKWPLPTQLPMVLNYGC